MFYLKLYFFLLKKNDLYCWHLKKKSWANLLFYSNMCSFFSTLPDSTAMVEYCFHTLKIKLFLQKVFNIHSSVIEDRIKTMLLKVLTKTRKYLPVENMRIIELKTILRNKLVGLASLLRLTLYTCNSTRPFQLFFLLFFLHDLTNQSPSVSLLGPIRASGPGGDWITNQGLDLPPKGCYI